MSLEFLLTSLIVILLPGPGVVYVLAAGLGRGFRASVAATFGCTMGILPAAVASIVGLAAVFHTSALAFQLLKYLGVAYLLYMTWSILRHDDVFHVQEDLRPVSLFRTALGGMLLNVLNPKLSLFFLAFLPQFVHATDPHAGLSMALLAAVFMLMTVVIFVGYGACAAMARDYVISRPKILAWLKRSFAAAFGALGLKLALAER